MFRILALVNFLVAFLTFMLGFHTLIVDKFNDSTIYFSCTAMNVISGIFFLGMNQIINEIKGIIEKMSNIDRHLCNGLQYICDGIHDISQS